MHKLLTVCIDDESSDSDESSPAQERDTSRTLSTPTQSVAGDLGATRLSASAEAVPSSKPRDASDDSDSDSSSESSSSSDADVKSSAARPVVVVKKENAMADVTEKPGDDTQVTKKRRTSEGGASVATAIIVNNPGGGGDANVKQERAGKPARKVNAPFRRVDPDKVSTTIMMDNRYQMKARFRFLAYLGSLTLIDGRSWGPAMITGNVPIMILSSPVVQGSARRRTRKNAGVIVVGRSQYVHFYLYQTMH